VGKLSTALQRLKASSKLKGLLLLILCILGLGILAFWTFPSTDIRIVAFRDMTRRWNVLGGEQPGTFVIRLKNSETALFKAGDELTLVAEKEKFKGKVAEMENPESGVFLLHVAPLEPEKVVPGKWKVEKIVPQVPVFEIPSTYIFYVNEGIELHTGDGKVLQPDRDFHIENHLEKSMEATFDDPQVTRGLIQKKEVSRP
jgi:hypothetical protein